MVGSAGDSVLGGSGACNGTDQSSTGGGGGAKSSRQVSTERAGRDLALLRVFPKKERGLLVLLGEGAKGLEAEPEGKPDADGRGLKLVER